MLWTKRKPRVDVPDDTAELEQVRGDAENTLHALLAQDAYVTRLARTLIARRQQNHFGDAIHLSFTRRGNV